MTKIDRNEIMNAHRKGKISVENKMDLQDTRQLSIAYTPGVAEVCREIAASPDTFFDYTISGNTVAVVTDGSAVLGLGNIGPKAAMPVMEGKAMLFKRFGGVDAFPILLDTQDVDEIVKAVKSIAPTFGGVNLEDISAPRCFEVERRLIEELDIPVFHDDQHGTAVVTLAGLINALRIVGKKLSSIKVVVNGIGAAGTAITKLLLASGATVIVGCDKNGAVSSARKDLEAAKQEYLSITNPRDEKGTLKDVIAGADVFIGVSAPGVLDRDMVMSMNDRAIVFAMANPIPEIMPEDIADFAAVIATGRSDYPNQINNVLCFPGLFKGLLQSRARRVTTEMLISAANAIAELVTGADRSQGKVIPSVFHPGVADAVAEAICACAER